MDYIEYGASLWRLKSSGDEYITLYLKIME